MTVINEMKEEEEDAEEDAVDKEEVERGGHVEVEVVDTLRWRRYWKWRWRRRRRRCLPRAGGVRRGPGRL